MDELGDVGGDRRVIRRGRLLIADGKCGTSMESALGVEDEKDKSGLTYQRLSSLELLLSSRSIVQSGRALQRPPL